MRLMVHQDWVKSGDMEKAITQRHLERGMGFLPVHPPLHEVGRSKYAGCEKSHPNSGYLI
jgi:hypothetical protein